MTDLRRRAVVDEMRQVIDEIEQIDTGMDISYPQFKQKVLPLLVDGGAKFTPLNWINITSHPNVSMRVLNTDGSIKYHIPAFLDSREITTKGDLNLTAAMSSINDITAENPSMKGTVIHNMLSEFKASDGDMLISSVESTIVLNQIYKDHNEPLIALPEDVINAYKELTGKTVDAPTLKPDGVISTVKREEEDIFVSDEFDLP